MELFLACSKQFSLKGEGNNRFPIETFGNDNNIALEIFCRGLPQSLRSFAMTINAPFSKGRGKR